MPQLISMNGQSRKLRRLQKQSHFLMDEPSITLREATIYFNASARAKLELDKYSHCYLSIEEGVNGVDALRVYLELNNEQDSQENCTFIISPNKTGVSLSGTTTVVNQIPKLKALTQLSRNERRIFLEFDDELKLWYMPLVPSFEFKTNELRSLVTAPAIYQCLLDNEILYIGESNNLSRRIKEHLRDETMSFDEVRYSVMNGISDDERRKWESFHITKYVSEKGALPPFNAINGRSSN